MNTDGTVDSSYNPQADAPIAALALQSDGKVVVGGSFTTIQPNTATSALASSTPLKTTWARTTPITLRTASSSCMIRSSRPGRP